MATDQDQSDAEADDESADAEPAVPGGLPEEGPIQTTTIEKALAVFVMALMVLGMAYTLVIVVRYWYTVRV